MKKTIMTLVMLLTALTFASCGGGGGGGGEAASGPSIKTLSEMPSATSPMASSSASINLMSKVNPKVAATGMALGETTSSDFNGNSSRAACEMFNVLAGSFQAADQSEMIRCYVQNMEPNFVAAVGTSDDFNLYDGEYHIFGISISGQEVGPSKIKMKVEKNESDEITALEMFACKGSAPDMEQVDYVDFSISGSTVSMTSKGASSDQKWAGSNSISVQGTLNDDLDFTSRTIDVAKSGSEIASGNQNYSVGTLTQTPGSGIYSGFKANDWTDGDNSGSHSKAVYGVIDVLNDTSEDLLAVAIGDGTIKANFFDSWGDGEDESKLETGVMLAWTGDDGLPVKPPTGSTHYAAAYAGTVPDISVPVIAFEEGETWDCSGEIEGTVSGDGSILKPLCEPLEHKWVNCHKAIEQDWTVIFGGPCADVEAGPWSYTFFRDEMLEKDDDLTLKDIDCLVQYAHNNGAQGCLSEDNFDGAGESCGLDKGEGGGGDVNYCHNNLVVNCHEICDLNISAAEKEEMARNAYQAIYGTYLNCGYDEIFIDPEDEDSSACFIAGGSADDACYADEQDGGLCFLHGRFGSVYGDVGECGENQAACLEDPNCVSAFNACGADAECVWDECSVECDQAP